MTCDIELMISQGSSPGQYRVQVVHAAAGGEPEASLALDVEGLLARHDELERALLASSVPARSATTAADQAVLQVGEELFRSLFDGPVNDSYRASLGVAQQRGERLRVVLRLTEPELAGLPWEMLYDSGRRAHLCLEEPIVRRIPAPYVVEPLHVEPPLRVLGLVASPRGLPALDVEAEIARLTEAIGDVVGVGLVTLTWVRKATWANILRSLLSGEWHVVHFIGHGDYDRQRGGLLAFESDTGRPHLVEASQFAQLLGQARPSPRLVVLNSCSGGEVGKEDLFSGTASTLIHSGIDAVTAMQFAVSDQAAIAFARGFYTAIASGRGVDEAVGSGRIAILGMPEVRTLEWATPVLYLRGNVTHPIKVEPRNGPIAPPWLESERMYDEALAEYQLGRYESAVGAFRRLMDRDPDYRNAAELLDRAERAVTLQPVYDDAVSALDRRDTGRALELVDRILVEVPDHRPVTELRQRALQELYDRADGNLRSGNAADALASLDELDQHAPDHPGSRELRRRALHEQKSQDLFDRADGNLRSGNAEAALAALDELDQHAPDHPGSPELRRRALHELVSQDLFDRADGNLRSGNAEAALAALDELDQHAPDHPGSPELRQRALHEQKSQDLYDRADGNLRSGNAEAALAALDELDQHAPDHQGSRELRQRAEAARAADARRRKRLLAGGASLLGAGAVIVAWLLIPWGSSSSSSPTSTGPLSDNEVVVSIGNQADRQLVAVDVKSGKVRDIDTPGPDDTAPNPSPDRSTIAYLAARPHHKQPEPRLVDVDGSHDRAVLKADVPCPGGSATVPGWSPDGETLAEVCVTDDDDKRGTALYTVSLTASEPPHRVLRAPDGQEFGPPTWSGDGRITMWQGVTGQTAGRFGGHLISVDPKTSDVETLTEQRDTQPDWDGQDPLQDRLVFLRRGSDETQYDQIMMLDLTKFHGPGTGTKSLKTGFVRNPTWSPDGQRIAYLERDSINDDTWRLMVMKTDGSDPQPVDLSDLSAAPTSLSWGTH